MPLRFARAAIGASLLQLSACQSCEPDKPYTPFKVASGTAAGAPAIPASTATASVGDEAPAFVGRRAEIAPKNTKTWRLGDQELTAPPGFVFEQGLSADFNDDARLEAVAWLTPSADVVAPGAPPVLPAAWLFEAGLPPRMLTPVPGFVPSTPDCQRKVELSQTGPHSLTLDIRAECQAQLLQRSATRALLVLGPFSPHTSWLTLRIAPPPPGETLDIQVESTDRDNDNSDDVAVQLKVGDSAEPEAAVSAPLIWLDRALGLARDPSEPANSLAKAAYAAAQRAGGKTSQRALASVRALVRYYGQICGESGTYRITSADGGALACGTLDKTAKSLTQARLRAALKQKNGLGALAALTSASWYLGAPDADSLKKLVQEFTKTLTQRRTNVIPVTAKVRASLPSPRFSPLSFDAQGDLLVLGEAGVLRVQQDGSVEVLDADAGFAEWPLLVATPALTWTGVSLPCDTAHLSLTFKDAQALPLTPTPTSFLAPRPGTCARGKGPGALQLAPLGWRDGKLFALVGGMLIEPAGMKLAELPVAPGSPRSPDGKILVVPSPFGLFVQSAEAELWLLDPSLDAARLSDCVIQNGGGRAACLNAGRPVLFEAQGALARSK